MSSGVAHMSVSLRTLEGWEIRTLEAFFDKWHHEIRMNASIPPTACASSTDTVYNWLEERLKYVVSGAVKSVGQAGWQFYAALQRPDGDTLRRAVIWASGSSQGDQCTPLQPEDCCCQWWPCVVALLPRARSGERCSCSPKA